MVTTAAAVAHPLEHFPLVRGRVDEDGMEDDDGRDGQPLEDGEDLVAVGPAVNPVLVLDDDGVETIQNGGRLGFAARRVGDEVMDDLRPDAALESVDDPNDPDLSGVRLRPELVRQSGGEGGKPALGGCVRRKESVPHRHRARSLLSERTPALRRGATGKDPSRRGDWAHSDRSSELVRETP
jgi:hypothetical protein